MHPPALPETQPSPAGDPVPLREKVAFSFLAVAQQLGSNGVRMFIFPAYGIILGLDPATIGTALALMILYDALIDPLFGWLSDNARTRWGRRRPFIMAGATIGGILFSFLWLAQPGWDPSLKLAYLLVVSLLFFAALTSLLVPGMALGWELTGDYVERTRVMSWYSVVAKIVNIAMPWMFALTQASFWPNDVVGLRATGLIFGVAFLLTGIVPAIFCRERNRKIAAREGRQSLIETVKLSFSNKTYMLICGMTLTTIFGGTIIGAFGTYVAVFYLYSGDKAAGAMMSGYWGTAMSVVGLITIFVINRFFAKTDKRDVLIACILMSLVGWGLAIFMITPANPWLSIVPAALNGTAAAGFWLVILSMIGDACDDDELKSGYRREGALAAFVAFLNKAAATVGSVLGGIILTASGFRPELAVQPDWTLFWMKTMYIAMPIASFLLVLVFAWKYPLTHNRVAEIQAELVARRGAD